MFVTVCFRLLRQNATKFLIDDIYRNPGPLQFEGPGADSKAVSLCVEDQDYMGRIKKLQEYLDKVWCLLPAPILSATFPAKKQLQLTCYL